MAPLGFTAALLSVLLSAGHSRIISDPLTKPDVLAADSGSCSECTGLLHSSQNLGPGSETKAVVYGALQALCRSLPSAQGPHCQAQVNTHLATALLQPPNSAKWKQSCQTFGLCPSKEEEPGPGEAPENTGPKGQFSPVCSLCVLVIKKLETLLPKNMTEDALRALLAEVCSLVPQSYKDQCDDFVKKYGDQIVDFLLSSAAPHTICTLLHLCLLNDTPAPDASVPSDCDSCRSLSVLSRLHLSLDRDLNQTNASAFLKSVCALHPQAIPKCEAFTRVYSSQLLRVLGHRLDAPDACERAALCGPLGGPSLLGERRCSWGPSYWCRDMKTAQECGNQAFCKRFVWK